MVAKKTNYSATFSYAHDEGVLLTDDFKRYNVNLKINTQATDRFKFGATIAPSYSDQRRFDGSAHDILRQTEWLPLYHDANTIQYVDRNVYPDVQIGDYAVQRHFDNYDLNGDGGEVDISNTSNTNPAAKVLERDRNDYKFKIYGKIYGRYKIMDGLTFESRLSGDYQNTERDRWQGVLSDRRGASRASLQETAIDRYHLVNENFFTYRRNFGSHEFDATLGMSAESYDTKQVSVTGTGYDSDLIQTISAATVISGASSIEYENRLLSFFGRLNYAYDFKYLVSLSLRRDGSSVFGTDNKYGNFPAISVGWVATQEDFFPKNDVLNFLKFRFSYGLTGNNRLSTGDALIDNYPYLALLNATSAVVDGGVAGGFNAINIANQQLKWERSREINPGMDFEMFNGRVSGSLEYYKRTSDQLLLYNPISSTTGFTEALVNLGEVENSGVEFNVTTYNVRNKDFTWSTSFIGSKNDNELVAFGDSDGQIQNVDSKRAAEWINEVGQPISSFYGWVVDGDIALEHLNNAYHPVGGQAQDVYVKT